MMAGCEARGASRRRDVSQILVLLLLRLLGVTPDKARTATVLLHELVDFP